MALKKLMTFGIALSVFGVANSQINVKPSTVSIDQGITNPYGNLNPAKGETRMKKNFERDENMNQDQLASVLVHWNNVAPKWIHLSLSNGFTYDIPPGTPSDYSSGTFYLEEGYYDFTFIPYNTSNGYQDYAVGCEETAYDKYEEWTIYNVHITDECDDIFIGHGPSF